MKKNKYWSLADSEISLSNDIDDAIQVALAEITEQKKEMPETLRIGDYELKKPDIKSIFEYITEKIITILKILLLVIFCGIGLLLLITGIAIALR